MVDPYDFGARREFEVWQENMRDDYPGISEKELTLERYAEQWLAEQERRILRGYANSWGVH